MPTNRNASSKTQPYLVVDVETNVFQKGNPFSKCGKLVAVGVRSEAGCYATKALAEYKEALQHDIQDKLLVGFSIKFDLHWLRNYEIDFSSCSVWDCQLAHFILSGQSFPYPSLNAVCNEYGLDSKLDVVATEYWEKGIDTEFIPDDVLLDYLLQDLLLTEQVYHHQLSLFEKDPQLLKLFKLHCQDLLVLQEMEYNGLLFDHKTADVLALKEEQRSLEIEKELQEGYEDIPINFQSRDHLSCYLYGGTITDEVRMPIGFYKTGAKVGQERFKVVEYKYDLPQLIKPPKGSELKKEGFYATDSSTLLTIKAELEKEYHVLQRQRKKKANS